MISKEAAFEVIKEMSEKNRPFLNKEASYTTFRDFTDWQKVIAKELEDAVGLNKDASADEIFATENIISSLKDALLNKDQVAFTTFEQHIIPIIDVGVWAESILTHVFDVKPNFPARPLAIREVDSKTEQMRRLFGWEYYLRKRRLYHAIVMSDYAKADAVSFEGDILIVPRYKMQSPTIEVSVDELRATPIDLVSELVTHFMQTYIEDLNQELAIMVQKAVATTGKIKNSSTQAIFNKKALEEIMDMHLVSTQDDNVTMDLALIIAPYARRKDLYEWTDFNIAKAVTEWYDPVTRLLKLPTGEIVWFYIDNKFTYPGENPKDVIMAFSSQSRTGVFFIEDDWRFTLFGPEVTGMPETFQMVGLQKHGKALVNVDAVSVYVLNK